MLDKKRTLSDWLTYIEATHPQEIEMGLSRMRAVYDELAISFECPLVIVGGTNGKGSVCATMEAIFSQAGYTVGLHTSPHVHAFNERCRINGVPVGDEQLIPHFEAVEVARGEWALTYFEFSTLVIMRLFSQAKLDVAIMEVGLGGRLDAMNILDANVAIVTNVAIDHVDYLGDNRDVIGYEKACIYRPNSAAICGDPNPPESVLRHAAALQTPLLLIDKHFRYTQGEMTWSYMGADHAFEDLPYPKMRGQNQLQNASVAIAGVCALQDSLPVNPVAIHQGLLQAYLPGRFQVISESPCIILDVGHNPHAASALAENLALLRTEGKTYAVYGGMRDKDIESVLTTLNPHIDVWHVTDLPLPRALPSADIAEVISQISVFKESQIARFTSPQDAYISAVREATENDRILVFGSFLVVAGIRTATQNSLN